MKRKAPRADTLKVLYATSGNECAFPDCIHPIFNEDGLYIAQLCHIEAAKKGGPRYNDTQTNDERNGVNNLMFMCHRHHKETDDVAKFTVQKLKAIKLKHESRFTEKGKNASQEMIKQILLETSFFWNSQKSKVFDLQDLKIERDFGLTILDLFIDLGETVQRIQEYCDMVVESDSSEVLDADLKTLCEKAGVNFNMFDKVPYWENPFSNRNWDMHNIGNPNFFSHLKLCLSQLKVKVFEELLKCNPEDGELKQLVDRFRSEFDEDYDNSYYVD